MAKATITKAEYLQLEGLAALSARHVKVIRDCEAAMNAILGTTVDDYAVDDLVYGDRDVAWVLEALKITVVE